MFLEFQTFLGCQILSSIVEQNLPLYLKRNKSQLFSCEIANFFRTAFLLNIADDCFFRYLDKPKTILAVISKIVIQKNMENSPENFGSRICFTV